MGSWRGGEGRVRKPEGPRWRLRVQEGSAAIKHSQKGRRRGEVNKGEDGEKGRIVPAFVSSFNRLTMLTVELTR